MEQATPHGAARPSLIVIGGADQQAASALANAIHNKFAESMNRLTAKFKSKSWGVPFINSYTLDQDEIVAQTAHSLRENNAAILVGYDQSSGWEQIMDRLNHDAKPVSTLLLLADGDFGQKNHSRAFDHGATILSRWPEDVRLHKSLEAIRTARSRTVRSGVAEIMPDGSTQEHWPDILQPS